MARIWREPFDPAKHHVTGGHYGPPRDNLLRRWTYCVRVCSFTFEFHSADQIGDYLAFFGQKYHPSSIIPRDELGIHGGDNGEIQRWYERLPLWLFEEPKRVKVVKALEDAKRQFAAAPNHPS